MKRFFSILLFSLVFSLTAIAQQQHKNDSTKDSREIHKIFQYADNFEWFEYYDDYQLFIYDSLNIIQYNYSDSNNIWQVSHPNKGDWTNGGLQLYPDTFPAKVLLTDSINPYPTNNFSTVELHIVKPAWTSIFNFCWSKLYLFFFFKCDTDTLTDGLFVEISFDGGQTFVNTQDSSAVKHTVNGPQEFAMSQYLYNMALSSSYGISGNLNNGSVNGWNTFSVEYEWDNTHGFDVTYAIIKLNFISDSVDTYRRGLNLDNIYVLVEDWCNIISVNNIDLSYMCEVFPNPINEYSVLSFSNPECERIKLEIVDVKGRIIFEGETNEQQFSIGNLNLQRGIYYYRLSNQYGDVKIDKFVKN